jgi:transaldolase
MKIFLDTGSIKDIEAFVALGIIDGVTTNPSLMAKEKGDPREITRRICQIVKGPVSAEVLSTDAESMIREARDLAAIDEHVVVKLPFGKAGVQACAALSAEKIKVNMTLIFSPTQALLSAKVGAAYVSPFIGRLDDHGQDGMELIRDVVTIYRNYRFKTEVLVASVRHPVHVLEAAKLGADIATMPFAVMEKLVQHPLTDLGLARFLKDREKVPKG